MLILAFHTRLGLLSGLFPAGIPTATLYALLLSSHTCYTPARIILLGLMAPVIFVSSIHYAAPHSLLYSPVTSSFLSQNIFLNTYCRTLPAYVPTSV